MPSAASVCEVSDCAKPAFRRGLCYGHLKRLHRGKRVESPLREYGLPPQERLAVTALRYADAEEDEDVSRARDLLRKHAGAYAKKTSRRLTKRQAGAHSENVHK